MWSVNCEVIAVSTIVRCLKKILGQGRAELQIQILVAAEQVCATISNKPR